MKLKHLSLILSLFLLFSFNQNLFAQDDAAQKAMMEYMTPGKMHDMLAKKAGEWKGTIKLYMAPGAPPTVAEGTAVYEMILGGRYLQSKYTSNIMGMPMQGLGIDGYDNGKKKFFSTWYDNMGTGVLVMEGKYDEATKTLHLEGSSFDPASGKEVKVREVLRQIKEGHEIMEMYMGSGAEEFKSMEVELIKTK